MNKNLLAYCLLGLFLLVFDREAHAVESPKKILFVGNSFSFYNNGIHNHLGSLIRANGDWQTGKNRLRLKTLSGGHIHEHLSGLEAYLKEDKRGWDAVVLQAHSNEAVEPKKIARFEQSLADAISIIKKQKLQPILFMTWAYKDDPDMAKALLQTYQQQAEKHGVQLVPVGHAFNAASEVVPDVELLIPDVLGAKVSDQGKTLIYREVWKHPSVAGTYLAACVFYASLYQRSPEGNVFHAGLPADVAASLQALSWQVVSQFYQPDTL